MVKMHLGYRGKRQEHGKLEQLKTAPAGWNPEQGRGPGLEKRRADLAAARSHRPCKPQKELRGAAKGFEPVE